MKSSEILFFSLTFFIKKVPAASIALGTLFATTINVLWERQVKMRSCINKEVGELRLLRRALFGCFGTAQHSKRRATALQLLHDYTNTLVLETKGDCIQRLEDIQRNGGISMSEIDGEFWYRPSTVSRATAILLIILSFFLLVLL